ncbi:C-type lectin-related protein 4 [Elysia marginata]|uniref:C-type lectin-related protein 4 n=1 Tax=Elysia marginata TaxID=1093978 RepID=A0AAV4K200_9GAST|nr:C-type lectin-related protein 4 [Elysia marginata]
MYNSATGLCTPGLYLKGGIAGALLAPTSAEGNLFAPATCDTSDGFALVKSGTLSACIWASTTEMTYSNARAFCRNVGAHLYVSRSVERFNLLPHGIVYIIGLTDRAKEGTFVWDDNGNVITESLKSSLFMPGEPSNSENREDCVAVVAGGTGNFANDIACEGVEFRFVCERPLVL